MVGAKSTRIETQIQRDQLIEWDRAQTRKEADCLLRRIEFELSGDFRNVPLTFFSENANAHQIAGGARRSGAGARCSSPARDGDWKIPIFPNPQKLKFRSFLLNKYGGPWLSRTPPSI